MRSIFQHSEGNPYHISVGAVLVNAEGKICVHAFRVDGLEPWQQVVLGTAEHLYILMRESLEEGETLDEAVLRGIQEEFGATGIVKRYLGSIQARALSTRKGAFEKTTLYFEVECTGLGERSPDDEESHSTIEWHDPDTLIAKMRSQKNDVRDDLDESKIIEAYVRSH